MRCLNLACYTHNNLDKKKIQQNTTPRPYSLFRTTCTTSWSVGTGNQKAITGRGHIGQNFRNSNDNRNTFKSENNVTPVIFLGTLNFI